MNRLAKMQTTVRTEEVDDEPAVGSSAAGMAKVGLPVRRRGGRSSCSRREDGRVSGVSERVAEREQAGVPPAVATGVRMDGGRHCGGGADED
jgi:hypothetical protein